MANSSNISEGILAGIGQWHGSIDSQFSNISNLTDILNTHRTDWSVTPSMLSDLIDRRDILQVLINHCRSASGTKIDRERRNSLLKSTVGFCLLSVKIWAYGAYEAKTITADDVHTLGFLLPGEIGGYHGRADATDILAEAKVTVINEDFARVVVDRSSGENAGQVAHGWPAGVKQALIVITSADGQTEVYRQMTTRLHNDIRMPENSRGKQFIVKAAFLRHVNDEPRFGNAPTFTMPLSTEDLAATVDRQHHEEFEEHLQEIERQRREIERLQAELNATKNNAINR